MFVIDKENNKIKKIESGTFSDLGFSERKHLQEWLEGNPDAFGEELLIIQKEFDGFNDTRERLDLLAIDKQGNLVVIENKLDDSGRDVTWQALKYASYCSSLTKQQIKDIYQKYIDKKGKNELAENSISEFLGLEDFGEVQLNKIQRIILVSGNYRKEVTSTVLWLLTNYSLRIQCFKATPYKYLNEFFLTIEQIIPVKEIEDFTIKMAEKAKDELNTQEGLKTRHKLRLDFWKQLLPLINSKSDLFSNISPSKDNWIGAGAGISGVSYDLGISRNYARVEVYMYRSSQEENKFIFDSLYSKRDEIEKITGKLEWERLDDKKASRIKKEIQNVSLYNKEDWEDMMDFMIESIIKLEAGFKNHLKKINLELKSINSLRDDT